jgi:hypothetical protein
MIMSDIICDLGSRVHSGAYYESDSFIPSSSYPTKNCIKYLVTDPSSDLLFIVHKPKDKRIKNWLNFRYIVENATEYNIKFRLDYESKYDLDLISVSMFRIKPDNPEEQNCSKDMYLNLCNSREKFTDYLIEFSYVENGAPELKTYQIFKDIKNIKDDRFICRNRSAWLIIPKEKFLESNLPLIHELDIEGQGSFYIPNSELY